MATRPETARKILVHWMDGVIAFVAFFFTVAVVTAAREDQITIPVALVVWVSLMGVCGLFLLILRTAFEDRPRPVVYLVVSGLLAVLATALIVPDSPAGSWEMALGIWLSGLALCVRARITALWFVAVTAASTVYISAISDLPWQVTLAVQGVSNAVIAASMMLWLWLWRTIKEAHHSRDAKARLAVSEERLRFARDLHDLLGHSLSVITLKSELAAKLAERDAGRAAEEIAQVRTLAADARLEVDAAVQGYRQLDLDAELAGVRAALEAAGATCVVEASAADLSPAARALLAWVVREGATNVLKHSTAKRCVITLREGVLEMRNDGLPAWPSADDSGTGLRGLSERLAAAGGSLSAAPTDAGEFVLRAAVSG
ncbi:sensor histidine kinase [Nonomuraea sp. NPDC050556]|uniref:sensor histidine kinase n=1 Tax=Nonomuraea sp. NPDC050556 TaxID=3364369 RepID=UPI003788830D